MVQSDHAFCEAVAEEMTAKFGRALTAEELLVAEQSGKLGSALEKLAKESPYKQFNR